MAQLSHSYPGQSSLAHLHYSWTPHPPSNYHWTPRTEPYAIASCHPLEELEAPNHGRNGAQNSLAILTRVWQCFPPNICVYFWHVFFFFCSHTPIRERKKKKANKWLWTYQTVREQGENGCLWVTPMVLPRFLTSSGSVSFYLPGSSLFFDVSSQLLSFLLLLHQPLHSCLELLLRERNNTRVKLWAFSSSE